MGSGLITLLVGLSLALVARAGYIDGDCILVHSNGMPVEYFEWVYDLFLRPPVKDTALAGAEIARFNTANVVSIPSHYSKYIHVTFVNQSLILTLKKEFENFEENEHNTKSLKLNLDFQCTTGNAGIMMWGEVEDSNNHSPQFEIPTGYTYTLPLPYPPAVPLGCTTDVSIGAVDVDLTNTRVTFEMSSGPLEITGGWVVGRTFYANISATQYITEEATLNITAVDNGEPKRSTVTTIHIKADKKLSLKRTGHGDRSVLQYRRSQPKT